MTTITTGAPKKAVTVLMLSSEGAKRVLASRSQKRQKILPPRKQAGIMMRGRELRKRKRIIWGTAIPTKETGPAKAVTQAESMLLIRTRSRRNRRMLTPTLSA